MSARAIGGRSARARLTTSSCTSRSDGARWPPIVTTISRGWLTSSAPSWLGDRPTPAALLQLILALGGVAVVLGAGPAGWPVPSGLADWLALAGGFCFALTNILLRKLQGTPAPARILAMFGGGAAMAMAAGVLGMGQGIVTGQPR